MKRLSLLFFAFVVVLASGCAASRQRSGYPTDQLKSLGEKALMANETATSLKFLTEAEKARPNDASIEYDLALAYNQRGLQEEALLHIRMALKIKPDYPEALNALGYIYATTGQFDLAREAFEKAMNDPFYQTPQIAALNLGQLYEKHGDFSKALSYYRQAAKLSPHYAQAWYRIGTMLERSGNNDEAKAAYETAVREAPDLAEAHLRLGIMSYKAGDFREAAGAFGMVERVAPFNSEEAGEARKYLEKINNPDPAIAPSHRRSSRQDIEIAAPERKEPVVFSARYGSDAPASTTESADGPAKIGASAISKEIEPPKSFARAGSDSPAAALIAPRDETGTRRGNAAPGRESKSSQYTVMIAAYPVRAKAEHLRSHLAAKGYSAVVRQDRENAFMVQLKPVHSFAEAAVLMSRVKDETHGSPSIVATPGQ